MNKLTFKQFLAEKYYDVEIDGYKLYHEDEIEPEENRKIWHYAVDPKGKEETLHHTPYEEISTKAFAEYVKYHKKHGKWPGRSGNGNWRNETAHKMNEA